MGAAKDNVQYKLSIHQLSIGSKQTNSSELWGNSSLSINTKDKKQPKGGRQVMTFT